MKIAYYPTGTRDTASSRLRVYKIGDAFAQQGHEIAYCPDDPTAFDVVVVQKRLDCTDIMRRCRDNGVRVVYDVDDQIANLPVQYADQITVDTNAKRDLYPSAIVIPDALDIERDSPFKRHHDTQLRRVGLVCNAENVYHVRHTAEACQRLGIDLWIVTDLTKVDISEYGALGVQWHPGTVDHVLISCDLLIAPFVMDGGWSEAWVRSKSANRILKAWALGLPVAATSIPSYVEAGLRYSASSVGEWVNVLSALRSVGLRTVDARRGNATAQCYTAERVAEQWLSVFERETVVE